MLQVPAYTSSGSADGFGDMNGGNAMLAARQAATAQLELFRAEMAAETAKMRAVVERQVSAGQSVSAATYFGAFRSERLDNRLNANNG